MAQRFGSTQPKNSGSAPNSAVFVLMVLLVVVSLIGAAFLLGSCDPRAFLSSLQQNAPGSPSVAQASATSTQTPSSTETAAATMTPVTTTATTTPPRTTRTIPATATPVAISPATPTPKASVAAETVSGTINEDVVNIRMGPGTNYPVLGQVVLDQEYAVTGRNEAGSWLQLCCPIAGETESWISAQFVDLDADVQSLPVVDVPPTPEPSAGEGGAVANVPVVNAVGSSGTSATELAAPATGLPGPGGFAPPGSVNPLTGQPLSAPQRTKRPLVVCINNDFAARPQYGTSRAAVMYEYLMEGFSVTRFSGIFYAENVERIGPIRSARLINYYMGALYDAGLVCSGASDQVRFTLKNDAPFPYLDIDLDDPSNSVYSTSLGRDYRTRLQTDTASLRRWLADWGVEKVPNLRGFTFGEIADGGAPASAINIPYPTVTGSQVAYRYDVGSKRYLRFLGGQPHLDGGTGTQLALDNVVVQYVPHQITNIVEDSLGSKSIRLNLFGSGKAIVFRNGLAFEGTWRSSSRGDMPHFFDTNGIEIRLKPGHTWISIVPLTYTIKYQ